MVNMFNLICRCRLSNLGVSLRNPQIFSLSFSSSSSSSNRSSLPNISGNGSSVTVDYLMNSCGFSPENALSVSKYMTISKPDKADSVLAFLKNHGFTQTQILRAVKGHPQILTGDPKKTLYSKLEFLSTLGLSSSDIAKVVSFAPKILLASLENKIIPCYNFFRNFLQSDEKTIRMIKRDPKVLFFFVHEYVVQNIQCLQEFGVPKSNMVRFITHQAGDLVNPPDKFRKKMEEVKKIGFDPSMGNFIMAVLAIGSMSKSSWEKKMEIYKKWGLSEEEIFVAFGKTQWFMRISEEKMERVMAFIVSKMDMKSSVLVQCPVLISLSLEKRTAPRLLLYKILLERGLIKKENKFSFNSWLKPTENNFINLIRKNYKKEAPQLLKLYQLKLNPAI